LISSTKVSEIQVNQALAALVFKKNIFSLNKNALLLRGGALLLQGCRLQHLLKSGFLFERNCSPASR
jgi:hypothetical protein